MFVLSTLFPAKTAPEASPTLSDTHRPYVLFNERKVIDAIVDVDVNNDNQCECEVEWICCHAHLDECVQKMQEELYGHFRDGRKRIKLSCERVVGAPKLTYRWQWELQPNRCDPPKPAHMLILHDNDKWACDQLTGAKAPFYRVRELDMLKQHIELDIDDWGADVVDKIDTSHPHRIEDFHMWTGCIHVHKTSGGLELDPTERWTLGVCMHIRIESESESKLQRYITPRYTLNCIVNDKTANERPLGNRSQDILFECTTRRFYLYDNAGFLNPLKLRAGDDEPRFTFDTAQHRLYYRDLHVLLPTCFPADESSLSRVQLLDPAGRWQAEKRAFRPTKGKLPP